MCLILDSRKTVELRDKFKKKGKVFYKVFTKSSDGTVATPYMNHHVALTRNNYFVSDRSSTKITEKPESFNSIDKRIKIGQGIHVYTSKKGCDGWLNNLWFRKNFICRVIGYNKDLVAAGEDDDVVFTKVKIHPNDMKKLGFA